MLAGAEDHLATFSFPGVSQTIAKKKSTWGQRPQVLAGTAREVARSTRLCSYTWPHSKQFRLSFRSYQRTQHVSERRRPAASAASLWMNSWLRLPETLQTLPCPAFRFATFCPVPLGAKKFGMPLETREMKLLGRDIPGFCRDIPGEKEVCVKLSSPNLGNILHLVVLFFLPSSLIFLQTNCGFVQKLFQSVSVISRVQVQSHNLEDRNLHK